MYFLCFLSTDYTVLNMDNSEQKPLLVRSEPTPPLYSAIRPCDNLITNIGKHGEDAVFENGCYHSVNEEREAQLPEESQSKPGHVTHDTRAYATRWWLLLVTSLCVVMQNAVWATWGPIAKSAEVSHICISLVTSIITQSLTTDIVVGHRNFYEF